MYNKLFTKILDSSIWLESDSTRLVWLTLLAAMDEDGFAQFASVPNLAHRARVSLDACSEAVRCLESDDLNSSDAEHGGRRIERVAGGWMVLNAEKYRLMVTRVVARERNRERVKRFRERVGNASVMGGNVPVTEANVPVTPSDTDTDTNTGSETVAADSGQQLSTNVKDVNDTSAVSAHSRSRVQKQSTEAEAVAADSGPPSATAIREPGLILSPARYAQRLRFCAFVGSKIEIPNDLHAELRAKHGGPDPETALQNWYVTLNDRAKTEAWQIPTGKAIFAWVKDHYAAAFPPTPAPSAPSVVKRDRLSGQAQDQQQKTQEVIRLMRDEGLSREAAMSRVFR